jgi:hypothetical protein
MPDFPELFTPGLDYGESIVSSTLVECQLQHGNCYDCREEHLTDTGETIAVYYRSAPQASQAEACAAAQAAMEARVSVLLSWMAARTAEQAEESAKQSDFVEWVQESTPSTIARALKIKGDEAAHLKQEYA